MHIGVIGINHKLADLKLRERFARICQQRFSPEQSIHVSHTLVLLSTCNRTEVYFFSDALTETHSYLISILRQEFSNIEETFDQKLYSYFGHDCFKHLARVTAGLDSAIVAETEIQGQVKAAYETACHYQRLPSELHFLFQKSLKIGKQIRTELPVGRGIPDLEHAILTAGFQLFSEPEEMKVLFVGISEINRKILTFFRTKKFKNLTICNRTEETVSSFANKCKCLRLDWSHLSEWHDYDIVILGTKSPDYLLKSHHIHTIDMSHTLLIDLCVPRNVSPDLGSHPKISLVNIDQLNSHLINRREQINSLIIKAEDIAGHSTKQQIEIFKERERQRDQVSLTVGQYRNHSK